MAVARRHTVPQLLRLLKDPNPSVSMEAAKHLISADTVRVARGCLRILSSPGPALQRSHAAHVLGNVTYRRAKDQTNASGILLQAALDSKNDSAVRGQAIESLGSLFGDRASRRNITWRLLPLTADPSPEVRFWTAFALGTFRCRFAVPKLEILAASDAELCPGWWTVAEEASDALAAIRGEESPDRIPVHQRQESG